MHVVWSWPVGCMPARGMRLFFSEMRGLHSKKAHTQKNRFRAPLTCLYRYLQ